MDPLRRDLVTLAWGPDLQVSSLEGGAEGVLGHPASDLVGRPLAEVLGVSDAAAREFHLRATPEGVVEHFNRECAERLVCLRATSFLLEGDLRAASVLNLTALLDGAPSFRLSWLTSFSHWSRNPISAAMARVHAPTRNPGLPDQERRNFTVAKRELRTLERALRLLAQYSGDPEYALVPFQREVKLLSVRSLFQEVASIVEPELAERQVELVFEEEDRDLPAVKADALGLHAALSQLLLNVTLGLDPGARLGITLRRFGEGAQAVIRGPFLAVRPEEQRTLYEPFGLYQGRGGEGLSLAVLHQEMQICGGRFVAEDDGSKCTLYTLTFAG